MSDYRWAVHAYPPDYRQHQAGEIVALANELSDGRWSIRQSLGLVSGGLQTRARLATQSSSRGVWEAGARFALLIWWIWAAAGPLSALLRLPWAVEYLDPWYVLGAPLVVVALLTVSTRWWVASLITVYALSRIWATAGDMRPGSIAAGALVSTAVVVGIAWWLALATDGRRILGFGRTVLLTVVLSLWWSALISGGGPTLAAALLMVILTLVVLVITTSDPRPAATLAILTVQQLTWSLPVAIGNDATGFNFWGPLMIPVAIAVTLWAATHLGIRRLAQT